MTTHDPNGTAARWHMGFMEHSYQINHKPEWANVAQDALSNDSQEISIANERNPKNFFNFLTNLITMYSWGKGTSSF